MDSSLGWKPRERLQSIRQATTILDKLKCVCIGIDTSTVQHVIVRNEGRGWGQGTKNVIMQRSQSEEY